MGIPTLLATLTASGDSSLADTSSMTSAYDEYMFVMTDINPATDAKDFYVQFNADGASGYNESLVTTFFMSHHYESGASALAYETGYDQVGTSGQNIMENIGNGATESGAGILHVFSPASTTYATHFYSTANTYAADGYASHNFVSGYVNATAAITDIQFSFQDGGDFDGVVQVYGIS